jgi:type III pantothenate kinase
MTSLLAIDVGNTNTVLGVYRERELLAHWRLQTDASRTADEYAVLVHGLFALDTATDSLEVSQVNHGIMASVVPTVVHGLRQFFRRYMKVEPLLVGPGIKTGMPILYENPREVGADRIVNAVAAYEKLGAGCIVVDFGTATTWDVVTPKGEYLGGVIAPGVGISAQALYQHASKLPRVELARPGKVVGRNTVASIQSGMLYGYAAMVDGMVERIREEISWEARCIATGGLARLIASESKTIEEADEMLTLAGLEILFQRNR